MRVRLVTSASSARAGWISALVAVSWLSAPTPARAAASWHEVGAPAVNTTNCVTQASEPLSTSFVAWWGDLAAPPPLNTPYYVRVRWFVTGKPCIGGARVAPELFLPDGSTLAISAANPVKCFAVNVQNNTFTQETASCPQAPAVGIRGGLGFYPVNTSLAAWPTAQGFSWEIHVPILSTTPLNGVVTSTNPCPDCLTAAVWSIDGVSSPWSFPRVGIRTAASTGLPTITYPNPSATNITNTSADATVILSRAGTTGSAFIEDSATPPSGSTCHQTSINAQPVTAQSPAVMAIPWAFSQLDPGSTTYWRMCYVTSAGTTFWGVNQAFTTTGTPRPRLVSFSPDTALGGRNVTITGVDLAGATSVTINGASGPVAATVVSSTAGSVVFTVPYVAPLSGTVSVTTPGGTGTSAAVFRHGIDTLLDDIAISASTGGTMQNDVAVHFHSTEPFPAFECVLDSEPFARSCDAGVIFYYDLAPGPHSLQVTARADGYHDDTPLVVPFTIVNADTTPPETTLMGPQGYIKTNMVIFTFGSEPGATFECSDEPPRPFVPCTSPYTKTGVPDGFHMFAVRARDAALNVDPTPARTSYTVDTVAPETWLWSIVPPPGTNTTTSRTATFVVLAPAMSRFECHLDGAPFSTCRAPLTFSNLSLGSHTFEARASDLAGNVDLTPASRTWTITP